MHSGAGFIKRASACDSMQNQFPHAGAPDAAVHGQLSPSNVDIRCAITLARIALQTLADLNPEAASAIDDALGHEIEFASVWKDPETLAVIAILTDVRAKLAGEEALAVEDNVWLID